MVNWSMLYIGYVLRLFGIFGSERYDYGFIYQVYREDVSQAPTAVRVPSSSVGSGPWTA